MFEVNLNHLNKILKDFGIWAKVQAVTELQRHYYEKQDSQSKEVRLIIKIKLDNHPSLVVRFKNEKGVTQSLIEEQCRFAHLLFENGIQTPKQYRSGESFAKLYTICDFPVIVTVENFVSGQLRCVDAKTAEATGDLLAKTHNIAEKAAFHVHGDVLFNPLTENDLFSFSFFRQHEKELLPLEPTLYQRIKNQGEKCLQKISVFKPEPRYAVQGDISLCNLYKTKDGDIGLFDFNRSGDNNLYFDSIMQALFEARLMDYPENKAQNNEEIILHAFLKGYHHQRPFSQTQKQVYPYLYALISAFWKIDLLYDDNSLLHAIQTNNKDLAKKWLTEMDRRIHTLPDFPLNI
jgi:Ser/Thr protein kinase RdoA (MazF antagonist)